MTNTTISQLTMDEILIHALSKAQRQILRERAYVRLVESESIAATILTLVNEGTDLRTAGAVVRWVVVRSFGGMIVN